MTSDSALFRTRKQLHDTGARRLLLVCRTPLRYLFPDFTGMGCFDHLSRFSDRFALSESKGEFS